MHKLKTVVLVSEKISDRVILLSKIWKNKGYRVTLIYIEKSLIFNDLSAVDKVIKISRPIHVLGQLKKIKPLRIHYFCYGPDGIGMVFRIFGIDYILDYKDLFLNVLNSGHRKWRLILEREVIKKAIAITHRDNQIINYININKIDITNKKLIYIPEYYEKNNDFEKVLENRLTYKSSKIEIKAVMTGGYINEPGGCLADGINLVLKHLLNQGIKITVIGGNSNVTELSTFKIHQDDSRGFLLNNPNLTIKKMMDQESFERELVDYDFAIHITNIDVEKNLKYKEFNDSHHFKYAGSARIISYIKASLPILLSDRFDYNNSRLAGTKFKIRFDNNENYYDFFTKFKKDNIRTEISNERKKFELLENIDEICSRL